MIFVAIIATAGLLFALFAAFVGWDSEGFVEGLFYFIWALFAAAMATAAAIGLFYLWEWALS